VQIRAYQRFNSRSSWGDWGRRRAAAHREQRCSPFELAPRSASAHCRGRFNPCIRFEIVGGLDGRSA
jgi:hypothetical protein